MTSSLTNETSKYWQIFSIRNIEINIRTISLLMTHFSTISALISGIMRTLIHFMSRLSTSKTISSIGRTVSSLVILTQTISTDIFYVNTITYLVSFSETLKTNSFFILKIPLPHLLFRSLFYTLLLQLFNLFRLLLNCRFQKILMFLNNIIFLSNPDFSPSPTLNFIGN